MQRSVLVLCVLAECLVATSPARAGWLSDLLERGKLPPIEDVGLCVIAPSLCIANEINKDEIRKRQVERENEMLTQRLISYRSETSEFIKKLDIQSEQERLEVNASLNTADECLLKAKRLENADTCVLNLRREIFQIHRKYQTAGR
jgi:hypothetical protein